MQKEDILLAEFGLWDYIKNPSEIGAVASSSPSLGRAMAGFIPNLPDSYIVEVGSGDGALTREIIKSGISEDRLILIELEPRFIPILKKRY